MTHPSELKPTQKTAQWLYPSIFDVRDTHVHLLNQNNSFTLGTSALSAQQGLFIELSDHPLTLATLTQLNDSLKNHLNPSIHHWLLLISQCPGYSENKDHDIQQALALQAGLYRKTQEAFKASNKTIISVVHQIAVGGTYLIHGLSAQHRLACINTRFYGAIPPSGKVPNSTTPLNAKEQQALEDVKHKGLLTGIVESQKLQTLISTMLKT